MLVLYQPMSSPMMTRMFGLVCACALLMLVTAVKAPRRVRPNRCSQHFFGFASFIGSLLVLSAVDGARCSADLRQRNGFSFRRNCFSRFQATETDVIHAH